MSAPIFYKKNAIDFDKKNQVTFTVVDGVASNTGINFVDNLRNRNNFSGWSTTDSTDAGVTTMTVFLGDEVEINRIFLVLQNFKDYTVKHRLGGGAFSDFSTPIAETTNTGATKLHTFNNVTVDEIQIIINKTFVLDDDKRMTQLILTSEIGQLVTQMKIERVRLTKNRKFKRSLSGKGRVSRSIGGFAFNMQKTNIINQADIDLIQEFYSSFNGFIVWLSASDTTQFRVQTEPYRLQDIFLVQLANEYEPDWNEGHYNWGLDIELQFIEALF